MARLRTIENAPNFIYDETKTTRIYAEDLQGLDTRIYDLESATDKVPSGGTTGQVLTKKSNTDFDLEWKAGGGGGIAFDYDTHILNTLGAGIKGISYRAEIGSSYYGLPNRTIVGSFCYIPEDSTINSIRFYIYTQGAYTANNNNKLGLYSYSSGTLTKVAETASDDTLFKNPSQSWYGKSLTSSYSAVAGVYCVILLYNYSAQTTQPRIGSSVNASNVNYNRYFSNNSLKPVFFKYGYDDLPSNFNVVDCTEISQIPIFYLV